MDFFIKIIRSFFLMIDSVIYWFVAKVYELFIMLSETGIFREETITQFAGRIYVLLGVFMLFKVSFSLITYILNPDDLTDKSKGLGKLLQNFFVVLIGIVAVPYIFRAAYNLQSIVLKENVVGSLIMGMDASVIKDEDDAEGYIKNGGKLMSFTTLSAFIRLNPAVVGDYCAADPVVRDNEGRVVSLSDDCLDQDDVFNLDVNNGQTVGELVQAAFNNNNPNYYTQTDVVNLKAKTIDGKSKDWVFEYSFVISSIAGGFLAWILLLFCIDVATRSVKLGFLQLIAPIPIISYVDPKSGKDGMFKKWVSECTKTYFDVFIRLIAIYFALFVITAITNGSIHNVTTGKEQTNLFVKVFIIFGALMFAKQLPQLLANILGVKLEGGFTLNPMKKLGQSPYAAGAMGLVGGGLGGFAANALATKGNWKGKGFKQGIKNVGSMIGGTTSAGARGLFSGLTAGGKGSVLDGARNGVQLSNQARYRRDVNQDANYGFWQRRSDAVDKFAGIKNKDAGIGKYDREMKIIKRKMDNYQSQEQALRNAQALHIAENPNINFNDKVAMQQIKDNFVKTKSEFERWNDFEQVYSSWSEEEKYKNSDIISTYNDLKSSYESASKDLNTVQKYENFETRIKAVDEEYEKLRKEYGRYEDVSKVRDVNKNKK